MAPQQAYQDESLGQAGVGHRDDMGRCSRMSSQLDEAVVRDVVSAALAEDLRYGPDITTTATVAAGVWSTAVLSPRESGVLAGVDIALAVFEEVLTGDEPIEVLDRAVDGTRLAAGEPAIVLQGPTRGLLTAERTALNLLSQLSGVATSTAAWVSAVAGTGCGIRDSRKTVPGMRLLQKYAVRCGGGTNHRFGLGDAALIKDNHVVAAGSVAAALRLVRERDTTVPCQVEVDELEQLTEVLNAGADEVLLDNFTPIGCVAAVRERDAVAPGVLLEASGGLQAHNAHDYARTGVDFLAVGALTHSAAVLDVGMDLR